MRFPISLFLIFFLFPALAYNQGYVINMEGERLKNDFVKTYHVSQVLLSQPEDSCLGILTFGVFKKVSPLYFERNISQELSRFFKGSLPDSVEKSALIIKINRLFIYDIKKFDNHYAGLDLSISFLSLKESKYFEEFTANVSPSKLLYEVDVTIPSLIREGIESCIKQYMDRKKNGLIIPLEISQNELLRNTLHHPEAERCFTETRRTKGIYHTYYDFRENNPDTTYHFAVIHDYNAEDLKLVKSYVKFKGRSAEKDFWGFCDGDGDFIHRGNSFARLLRDSSGFYAFTLSAQYYEELNSSAILGGVLFGAMGAALMEAGKQDKNGEAENIIKVWVDPFSGKLVSDPGDDYTNISSDVIIYYSKLSDKEVTMGVYADGKFLCSLTPDTYLNARFSCHQTAPLIKLVTSNGISSEKTVPLQLTKKNVFLVKYKSGNSILFDPMHDQMKTDMIKGMKKEKISCDTGIR